MSDTPDVIAALAQAFLDAIERGDVEAVLRCYADDAVIWRNIDQLETDAAANVATLARFVAMAPKRTYLERRLSLFAGGFVEQHVLRAEREDGRVLVAPACLVCQVRDGRIARLHEYFDSAPVVRWLA